jgi:hypothetical protein
MIDELAVGGSWPDAVRDGVKALGGVWVGRWSLEGFDAEQTLSQVEAAKAAAINAETLDGLRARIVNAAALMGERIAVDSDPFELFAECWEDAI